MLRRHWISAGGLLLLAIALVPAPASAQTGSEGQVPARLRHIEGGVSVQRAAVGDTEAAFVNLPLEAGDRLWTDDSGRAELTFEDGSVIWLDERSTLDFVNLGEGTDGPTTIVRLWAGSLYLSRPDADRYGLSAFRVDAPAGSIVVGEPGLYRADVDDEQRLWLSTYEGYAELVAGGLREAVAAGQQTYAAPGTAPARTVAFNTAEDDPFAVWRADRYAALHRVDHYVATREYVPRQIVHHAVDLYDHGTWYYHADYGSWAWRPRVAVGWSPYRHGRWVYGHRGWIWSPYDPWAYVTVHYGRWHLTSSWGWVWFPGRVWSPAWVQWYVGPRHVGWTPLNFFNRPAVNFNVFVNNITVNNFDRRGPGPRGLDVGAFGSASGTGRVVKGLGYTSGAEHAWTFVESGDLGRSDVARRAVARNELASAVQTGSKALISGPLRSREPTGLVPRQARPRQGNTAVGDSPVRSLDVGSGPTPRTGYRAPGTVQGNAGGNGAVSPRQAVPRGGSQGVKPAPSLPREPSTGGASGGNAAASPGRDAARPRSGDTARSLDVPSVGRSAVRPRSPASRDAVIGNGRRAVPRAGAPDRSPAPASGRPPAVTRPAPGGSSPAVQALRPPSVGRSTGPARVAPRSPGVQRAPSPGRATPPARVAPRATPRSGSSPGRVTPRATPRVGSSPGRVTPRATPRVGSSPGRVTPRATPRVGSSPGRVTPRATPRVGSSSGRPTPRPGGSGPAGGAAKPRKAKPKKPGGGGDLQ